MADRVVEPAIVMAHGRPDPDPTVLTTAQLYRTVGDLKEIVFIRLDAMDKAMQLFNENITRVPTDVDKQVGRLKELMDAKLTEVQTRFEGAYELRDEKFLAVQTQFRERDIRVEQTAKDTKVAVDAALQAAEKAVGKQNESFALSIAKSEGATTKQIDAQGTVLATSTAALNDKIDDLKARLTLVEGQNVGRHDAGSVRDTHASSTVSMVGVIAAILFGLLSIAISAYHLSSIKP